MVDQLTLGIRLHDEANFSSFFQGTNEEIISSLKHLVDTQDGCYVFVYGEKGVGKSHLLQACCQYAASNQLAPFYLPLAHHLNPGILENLDGFSLVCLDDIHLIANDPEWEESLFHLFNHLVTKKIKLVISAKALPNQLGFKLADLVSRLNSGVTYHLKPLTDEQKVAALQLRANIRGFELTQEVGRYLLNHYPRDMTYLFELLELLDKASLQARHRITIPFVRSILKQGT